MLQTQNGLSIGIRRGWSDWQRDLGAFLNFAQESGFGVVDLSDDARPDLPAVGAAGLQIGSVDLLEWQPLFSPDAAKRADAVQKNREYIADCAALGARNFFCVIFPEDAARPRLENFGYAVESLNNLAPALEKAGAKLVIEGWPGPGALLCTPETCRAAFQEAASPALGLNYDPSHLVRMGIDPIRFLQEFSARVHHVHGKDAAISPDDLYEFGTEQPATFKKSPAFGAATWRYTIPGQGNSNWNEIARILAEIGYHGAISIELEDQNYNGSEDGEKRGFIESGRFLSRL